MDQFESRIFSSETLMAGVDMVERGAGVPSPDLESQEIMDEIKKMQDGLMLGSFFTTQQFQPAKKILAH